MPFNLVLEIGRKYWTTDNIDWLDGTEDWQGLKSIGVVESHRDVKGKLSVERRYFISSIQADPKEFASIVRNHWSIENNLHWTLDVVFNEDQSRVRSKNAAQNMAVVRHCVMNLLHSAKKLFKKGTNLKGLRKKACWGQTALATILSQEF